MLKKIRNEFLYASGKKEGDLSAQGNQQENRKTRLVIEDDTIYEIDVECEECRKRREL